MTEKQLLFSVTEKDFIFTYSRGSGKGGQKRNKTSTKVQCVHKDSGAMGQSDDTRSQGTNKKIAFMRTTETKKFKDWMSIEIVRQTGKMKEIEKEIEESMKKLKIEIRESGKWVEEAK